MASAETDDRRVPHDPALEDDDVARSAPDVYDRHAEPALIVLEDGEGRGERLQDERFDSETGPGDRAEEVAQWRGRGGDDVDFRLQANARHAHGVADPLLIVDDESARDHVEDLPIGRDLDRARRIEDAIDVLPRDLLLAPADADHAAAVDRSHVLAGDPDPDVADREVGHLPGRLDGAALIASTVASRLIRLPRSIPSQGASPSPRMRIPVSGKDSPTMQHTLVVPMSSPASMCLEPMELHPLLRRRREEGIPATVSGSRTTMRPSKRRSRTMSIRLAASQVAEDGRDAIPQIVVHPRPEENHGRLGPQIGAGLSPAQLDLGDLAPERRVVSAKLLHEPRHGCRLTRRPGEPGHVSFPGSGRRIDEVLLVVPDSAPEGTSRRSSPCPRGCRGPPSPALFPPSRRRADGTTHSEARASGSAECAGQAIPHRPFGEAPPRIAHPYPEQIEDFGSR